MLVGHDSLRPKWNHPMFSHREVCGICRKNPLFLWTHHQNYIHEDPCHKRHWVLNLHHRAHIPSINFTPKKWNLLSTCKTSLSPHSQSCRPKCCTINPYLHPCGHCWCEVNQVISDPDPTHSDWIRVRPLRIDRLQFRSNQMDQPIYSSSVKKNFNPVKMKWIYFSDEWCFMNFLNKKK
jgi:hypothetical protein